MKGLKNLAILGALIAAATPAVSSNAMHGKDYVVQQVDSGKKMSMPVNITAATGANFRHASSGFLNQRQYRKLCRQNPHLRKSKKHRSKN